MDGSPVVPKASFVNLESLETFEKMRKVSWVSWLPSDFPAGCTHLEMLNERLELSRRSLDMNLCNRYVTRHTNIQDSCWTEVYGSILEKKHDVHRH